jgi:hypothetical protein
MESVLQQKEKKKNKDGVKPTEGVCAFTTCCSGYGDGDREERSLYRGSAESDDGDIYIYFSHSGTTPGAVFTAKSRSCRSRKLG